MLIHHLHRQTHYTQPVHISQQLMHSIITNELINLTAIRKLITSQLTIHTPTITINKILK